MAKIAFVGAGSTVFAKNLLGDILLKPELAGSTIALHDIDDGRLATSEIVANKVATTVGAAPVVEATTDLRRALTDADYVITMFQVGGYEPSTVVDFEVPKQYGLRQTIGDTLGIGGIMRGLRTIPALLEVAHTMEDVAGDGTLLNYVNPMAMLCMATARATTIPTVGLCHSVQGTAEQLAGDLGIPVDEMRYRCAGINHMAFYLELEQQRNGDRVDLYPALAQLAAGPAPVRDDPFRSDGASAGLSDAVRYEVFRRLGYFVTESSEHFAEYVPWFVKRDRPDLLDEFAVPLDEYPRRCERQIEGWDRLRQKLENPDSQLRVRESHEFGSGIIHSMETGEPREIHGNVPNRGLVDNLPADACVEVACRVDDTGIHPQRVGSLPAHLAALMQTNINVQSLTVDAVLNDDRQAIYHAAMLDPHTAAELDLGQIWSLVDDLLDAHGEVIPAALRSV